MAKFKAKTSSIKYKGKSSGIRKKSRNNLLIYLIIGLLALNFTWDVLDRQDDVKYIKKQLIEFTGTQYGK